MIKASEIVSKTYGPFGKKVVINKGYIDITCDGYTVINSIYLEDGLESIGLELLKNASKQSKDAICDGTTSTIILGTELCKNIIDCDLEDHLYLLDIIEKIEIYILDELNEYKMKIDKNIIKNICYTSSNSDKISDIFCEIYEEIKDNGTLIYKPTYKENIYFDVYSGLIYDKGLASSYLSDSGKVILNDAYVVIVNDNIYTINELETIIYDIKKQNNDILIIANSFSKEVIDYIIYLNRSFNYSIYATYSPEFGNNSKDILSDIAIYLGTYVITNKANFSKIEDVGKAKYIEITKDLTVIKAYESNNLHVQNRINQLKKQEQTYIIKKRLSMLSGKVGCIFIPYKNEYEYNLLSEKVSNSISSFQNAIDYGIVNGAGKDLVNIAENSEFSNLHKKIIDSIKVLNSKLIGNNYLEIGSKKPYDSVIYYKEIIKNSFNLLKLFVSIGGVIDISDESKYDKNEFSNKNLLE